MAADFLDRFVDAAFDIGVPLAQKELGLAEDDVIEDRLAYHRLNGSGPNDANLARQAPRSDLQQGFGLVGSQASTGSSSMVMLGLAGLLAVILIVLVIRR